MRVGPLMGIPAVLRELGHDPGPILVNAAFNEIQFTDPDTVISYVAASKLLAGCVVATGCRHFGLLVGKRASPSSLGIAGFMLQSARDVGTALRDLVQHLDLHDQGGVPILNIRGSQTLLGYAIHQADAEATDQIYDLAVAVACNIMRALCGPEWKPAEVLLARPRPCNLAPYRNFFRASLSFNAGQNAISFPSRWLGHRILNADPLLHSYLEREANELHAARNSNLTGELRMLLRKTLVNRKCKATDIARQLCIHERTLHRKLREEGTSFQRELDDTRYQMAQQLLAEGTMPLAKIATRLNYADASTFNRAFKRWTGITPAQWRSNHESSHLMK